MNAPTDRKDGMPADIAATMLAEVAAADVPAAMSARIKARVLGTINP